MKIIRLFIFAMLSTFLAACSHTSNRSDTMLAYSKNAQALSNQWNDGDKMILKGKSLKEKGTDLIQHGQKQISKGSSLIAEGNKNTSTGHQMLIESEQMIKKGMVVKKESEIIFENQFPQSHL